MKKTIIFATAGAHVSGCCPAVDLIAGLQGLALALNGFRPTGPTLLWIIRPGAFHPGAVRPVRRLPPGRVVELNRELDQKLIY
jgi:hypothetical protein